MLGGIGREKSNRLGVKRTELSVSKKLAETFGVERFFRCGVLEENAATGYKFKACSAFCRFCFRIPHYV